MKIACDIDGVLLDFVSAFCKHIEKKYGWELKPEQITQFNIHEILGISSYRLGLIIDEVLSSYMLDPIDGAFNGLQLLIDFGLDIFLLTSRPQKHYINTATNIAKCWISEEIEGDIWGTIYTNGRTKKQICMELGIDIMIEDSIKEALTFIDGSGLINNDFCDKIYHPKVLLLRQPWNENCMNVANLFTMCDTWDDIVREVDDGC